MRNQIPIKNSHLKKKRFDSICSAANNKFFTFRAYFKGHDFEASLPIEIQSLKWNSLKKRIRLWSKFFPTKWDFEMNFFSKFQVVNWKTFVPADFIIKNFSNNHILEKEYFPETRFAPRTTTCFSLFVLILKGMILKQAFPLKFRVWNEILLKKKSDYEAIFFLQNEILNDIFSKFQIVNWEIFVPADLIIKNFSNIHILEKEYFPETQFLSSVFIEKSDSDKKFTSEKKTFWLDLLRGQQQVFHFSCLF